MTIKVFIRNWNPRVWFIFRRGEKVSSQE